jgi:hypothetical protein
MARPFTRREVLRYGASGALLGGALWIGLGERRPGDRDHDWLHAVWRDAGVKVRRGNSCADPRQQALWTTLMKVGDRISRALDDWYLWFWTHDAPICRIFTAPTPAGPYTDRGPCSLPTPPPGWDPHHFSAGDVVWDTETRRFYATPHSIDSSGGKYRGQATFLIQSSNGIDWTFVRSDPVVPYGPPGSFDERHAGYGRFLKDYDGNIKRFDGSALFYYRGELWPGGVARRARYALGLATSSDLSSWSKRPKELATPLGGARFDLGSALYGDGRFWIIWTVRFGNTVLRKGGRRPDDPYDWDASVGTPIYRHPTPLSAGSYVLDRASGRHHFPFTALVPPAPGSICRAELHLAVGR